MLNIPACAALGRQVRLVQAFAALLLVLLALAALSVPASSAPAFRTDSYDYIVRDYTSRLGKLATTITKTREQLRSDLATTEEAGNDRNTAVVVEQVLSKSPEDGALWRKLAELLLTAEPFNSQDGYELPYKALGAAIKAYSLAKSPEDQAATLNLAAKALVKREDWRPALSAYKASLALVEDAEIRSAYEEVREQHGFRITDYKVENSAVQPRVCFQLSDPPDNTVPDFASYFTQDPGPVSAVSVNGSQLCVEGLKHGARYKFVARKGLPSAVDEVLEKDAEYDIYVRDRDPTIRFVGKSYVLPRTGQNGIPIVTVNAKKAKLELFRIGDRSLISAVIGSNFLQQLYGDQAGDIDRSKGKKVWEGSMETASTLNEDVTTAFPVDEALGKIEPGLYVMTAKLDGVPSDEGEVATQWFVVSDLGLATMKGKDGLRVFVRSIATAAPLEGLDIRLLARNNEILGSAKTDKDGTALFEPGLVKGEGGMEPALVVAADPAGDYGFLDLSQNAFDFTDRGVSGRDAPGAVDAFVYVERGVYRRGETVHAAVLLRDDRANAVPGAPVTVVVRRPDGVEYSRTLLNDQGAGGRAMQIALIPTAAGGTWRVEAYTDPKGSSVGETSFLVEDYVPDRIEFDITARETRIDRNAGALLSVDGRYLFGAPAATLDLEGEVSVSADPKPFDKWADYNFGLTDENVDTVQNSLDDLSQTDAKGHADFAVPMPQLPTTTRPLRARIDVRMREPGGRALGRSISLPIAAQKAMLGIKPGFEYGVKEGEAASFSLIAVDPAGNPVEAKGATWSLKRLTTSYQWFLSGRSWNYEAVTTARAIAGGTVDIGADAPASLSRPLDWGQYRIEITAADRTSASYTFSVGYYGEAKADAPDMLPVALDRNDVKGGDTVQVKIDARFEGKAAVQVVGDRLLSSALIDVPKGGTTVPVTVGNDWGTGAYVVVTHFRPMDVAAKRMPTRSIGVAWFGIDRTERTLKVSLAPTAQMKPRQPLVVPVKVEGLAPGDKAYVTVAAVDVGILNLTAYKPPEPETYYYSQRRLSAEFRDLYGQLIDGMQGNRGRIRTGGDGGSADLAPPPTQEPMAQFSGIVAVGDDGKAEVTFDIPAFNGTVRLMAVAWTPAKVGHAATDVIVRDPVVIAGTLPRFLASGDQSRFRLDLLNAEATPGDYTLAVTVEGPVTADPAALYQTVKIGAAGSRTPVNIPITATGVGTAKLIATLAGPGDVSIDQTYTLGIMPANAPVSRRTVSEIAANGSIAVSSDLLAEMVPGTGAVSLAIGPMTDLDVPGLLKELDRYPYGCSEQLVSRALPLLYLSELGGNELGLDDKVDERLQDTVQRLLARQDSAGAFGLWDTDGTDLWLSAYVTDFLLRAREKGMLVPELALTSAVDYLRNTVGNAPDVEQGKGEDIAYALYTLARAGRAPAGDIKYFADTKIGDFGSALARAQVAAALGLLGDKSRADEAFRSAADALTAEASIKSEDRASRSDYGSVLRDAAAIVALAGDAKAGLPVIRTAAQVISTERARSRYTSTQEMTWMVLAARAVVDEARAIRLKVDGTDREGALYRTFRDDALLTPVAVANAGSTALKAVVAVSGSPKTPEPETFNGMALTRTYYTQAGEQVDPATVKQNTRLVVVLTAGPLATNKTGNFLLVDRLPAGFEIENPNLIGAGGSSNLPWLTDVTGANHAEFRDDRFVAAFSDQDVKLAYTVRAVAPGTYAHPGATVEDMYRPNLQARLASATVTVTDK